MKFERQSSTSRNGSDCFAINPCWPQIAGNMGPQFLSQKFYRPLVRLAMGRSVNGNALAENRAAILVATFHVLGISLEQILPEAAGWPQSCTQTVTVDGRDDFAKHFMVSATIAAYADTALSDAIGLYKEIEDSRIGSGFSFNDIAADRAGTQFGEKAVANEASAQTASISGCGRA